MQMKVLKNMCLYFQDGTRHRKTRHGRNTRDTIDLLIKRSSNWSDVVVVNIEHILRRFSCRLWTSVCLLRRIFYLETLE